MLTFNGEIVTATVTDQNETEVFAQAHGVTLALDASEFDRVPANGHPVTGFAYENQAGKARLTTKIPTVGHDHYAWAEVVEVRRDLGVFVSIGLPDKDIVVSLDQLPSLNRLWPARGDRLMVALTRDKKKPGYGGRWPTKYLHGRGQPRQACANERRRRLHRVPPENRRHPVLTDDFFLGFIHPSERDAEPRLGQHLHARVIGVRPDGGLNLSLRPRAYEAIDDDAAMVLAVLQHSATGTIPFTDKSDPDAIRTQFGISKSAFKRALGHLLKRAWWKKWRGKPAY